MGWAWVVSLDNAATRVDTYIVNNINTRLLFNRKADTYIGLTTLFAILMLAFTTRAGISMTGEKNVPVSY